jgi:hypothetical protein
MENHSTESRSDEASLEQMVDMTAVVKEDDNRNAAMADSSHGGSTSVTSTVADGEYHQLLHTLDDDHTAPLPEKVVAALNQELSFHEEMEAFATMAVVVPPPPSTISAAISDQSAWYAHPLSPTDAEQLIPKSDGGGLIWNVTIVPDQFLIPSKGLKRGSGLNHRDFMSFGSEVTAQARDGPILIKPRRPSLPVSANDFYASLTKIESHGSLPHQRVRYIFHGVLNGWPGLRTMELISLEYRRDGSSVLPSPREWFTGQILWVKAWSNEEKTNKAVDPPLIQQNRIYRAKLRGPSWTAIGWSEDSPGFCFWYEAQRQPPRVTFGTRMLSELASQRDSRCTRVHMISHRYAVDRVETPRDRLTYHSIVLLEWDHGLYSTVIETAYLNGMGGYRGKSNWYEDRDAEPMSSLYQAFPPEMICPWRMTQSEIRCYDVVAKNLAEFRTYMARYEGASPPAGRFVDVRGTFSHAARLTFRSKAQIAQYLLNYILRDSSYGELNRNCQTFAADLCSFLAGKKGVAPFHPVNRIDYQNRTYLFLYDSHLYEKKKNGNKTNVK